MEGDRAGAGQELVIKYKGDALRKVWAKIKEKEVQV